MSDQPDPTNMTLEELKRLALALNTMAVAGNAVRAAYLTPRFMVMPGSELSMSINYVVPFTPAETPFDETDGLSDIVLQLPEPQKPVTIEEVTQPEAATGSNLGGDPLPAGAFVDNAPDRPEIGCPAGSASAMAAAAIKSALWTEDEDDRAITAYVTSIMAGDTTMAYATAVAAKAVSRTFFATQSRLRGKLAHRVKAAMTKKPEIPAPPVVNPSTAPAEDKSSRTAGHAPIAPPPAAPFDAVGPVMALAAHLKNLPRKDSWSLEADLELARLSVESGWGLQDIALEFGMDAGEVKARWDALTGLHRDKTTDKLQRAFSGPAVFEGLKALAAA